MVSTLVACIPLEAQLRPFPHSSTLRFAFCWLESAWTRTGGSLERVREEGGPSLECWETFLLSKEKIGKDRVSAELPELGRESQELRRKTLSQPELRAGAMHTGTEGPEGSVNPSWGQRRALCQISKEMDSRYGLGLVKFLVWMGLPLVWWREQLWSWACGGNAALSSSTSGICYLGDTNSEWMEQKMHRVLFSLIISLFCGWFCEVPVRTQRLTRESF